ncbi:rRNA cytosine-C5-methyltransferase [Bacteroides sp. 51]|uniref:methyltransferase RsmF C-terminal domain-like protein n=1 Tax=Bacteroides sp. 51 TaxID=2302938 RepID=UPI0013D60D18|nr:rRNA cytosine-C5-methyltransferase [Bacteroides sp. 51]NDV82435.1 rRNA cytosine-C5-methyltransferase [Bacteroides sp. 51]
MNLPAEFAERTRALLGDVEYKKLVSALAEEAPVSIRLNPRKQKEVEPSIDRERFTPVPWCAGGYYLDERLTFTFDPLFHAGCYYVQEASSMFLEQAMRQHLNEPVTVLDLCAAPGGKSTHIRSLLPESSLLVANEVIRNRSQVLAENLVKWGHPDVMVTNNDPANFGKLEEFFDVILADVPCSGEGMFRKDSGAIEEWSPENVDVCWQRQRRIITDIWPCLKPGGILIYSTCTYNTKENEENVSWIIKELGAEPLSVSVPEDWGITGNLSEGDFPVYRFLPHKTKGEGFFLAVLRKEGEGEFERSGDKEALVRKHLRVIKDSGVEPGTLKGKDLIPSHAQAMSLTLESETYPSCELTYEQAIAYLRREAIVLDASVPRGYILVMYRNLPLGFVKNIGNRANNLYPQDWRIRSGYLPDIVRVL